MAFSNRRKIIFILLALVLLLGLAGCKVAPNTSVENSTPQLPQPKVLSDPTWIELNRANQKAVSGRMDVMAYLLYNVSIDSVQYSKDGSLALVWTALVDKTTGLVQSGEPGLVIAHKAADGSWSVVLQADATFAAELQALPDSLLSADAKAQYMPALQQTAKDGVVYRGYRLPWGNGLPMYLTGSIGHVLTYKSCPNTCLYAFDFANGTMFPIAASKAGVVKYAVWQYPNGNTTNPNYLVIEDTKTTPTTYVVYFHLAQNSIPPELRVPGAKVYQGQYLANADDTGQSTGHHLHFMVHTDSTSYWGTSVDIVFDEVTVNGGRPRTCLEAANFPEYGTECMPNNSYISRNGDNMVPTGGLTLPEPDTIVTAPLLSVSGWMMDDVQVESGQLVYKTTGDWTPIGPILTGDKFSTQIDLCAAEIADGPFSLALQVTDNAGKTSADNTGLTALTKNYTCPVKPPDCTPSVGQAALYTGVDFQGKCQVLDLGEYASLETMPNVQNDQTASVQLGSGVSLLLYSENDFGGTQELFQNGDSDLSDNLIGSQTVNSVRVVNFIAPPSAPKLTTPEGATSEDGVTLTWTLEEGVETRATLTGPNNYSQLLDWQSAGSWGVGMLAAGEYTLTVDARNLAGTASSTAQFSIAAPVPLPVVTLDDLPATLNSSAIALRWTVVSGWDAIDHFEIQWRVDAGEWTNWETQPATDDREAIFNGELAHTYDFRIRGVQANGKAADFSEAQSVTTVVSDVCLVDAFEGTNPGDDVIGGAAPLTVGTPQQHNWCTAGDVDWVAFQATKGQVLRLTTTAVGQNSAAREQLYDTDGVTLLGENTPADANSQASMDWTVPADGIYYVRYIPVDAQISGTDTAYTVNIELQSTVHTTPLVCGSVALPVLLGGGYALLSKSIKKKKTAKRAGWE